MKKIIQVGLLAIGLSMVGGVYATSAYEASAVRPVQAGVAGVADGGSTGLFDTTAPVGTASSGGCVGGVTVGGSHGECTK